MHVHIYGGLPIGALLGQVDFSYALLTDVDLRNADITGAIFFKTWLRRVCVSGLRGQPARFEESGGEDLDVSAAGDGSALQTGDWLRGQWGDR